LFCRVLLIEFLFRTVQGSVHWSVYGTSVLVWLLFHKDTYCFPSETLHASNHLFCILISACLSVCFVTFKSPLNDNMNVRLTMELIGRNTSGEPPCIKAQAGTWVETLTFCKLAGYLSYMHWVRTHNGKVLWRQRPLPLGLGDIKLWNTNL
jgi:hypothetical protein